MDEKTDDLYKFRVKLNYDEAFVQGIMMSVAVGSSMVRRKGVSPITSPMTMGAVVQSIILAGEGNHLEIGSRLGGSAVVAAQAFGKDNIDRYVICIDPMENLDPQPKYPTTVEMGDEQIFWQNINRFDVSGKIKLYKEYSNPFPCFEKEFSTAFIDGDHRYTAVMHDLENLRHRVTKYIVLDDVDYPGVYRAMVKFLYFTSDWTLAEYLYPTTAILVKVHAADTASIHPLGLFNADRPKQEDVGAEISI